VERLPTLDADFAALVFPAHTFTIVASTSAVAQNAVPVPGACYTGFSTRSLPRMNIKSDAVRHTLALAALRLVPSGVIARLLVRQPQAARPLQLLASIRETEIARCLANISQADIQRIIEVIEGEPELAEWRELLGWARMNPRKIQQIVHDVMALSGVRR
jgi:hypothetical protein